jgi:hypothetical protein
LTLIGGTNGACVATTGLRRDHTSQRMTSMTCEDVDREETP